MASSCSVKRAIAIVGLCAVFFMVGVQGCSLSDMLPCQSAVTSNSPPTDACCQRVAEADVVCFCNLVATGNYPANYITNAVNVPSKCGGAAHAKFQGQNCAGHVVP